MCGRYRIWKGNFNKKKINVCCVDEGVIMAGTLIRKYYGSKDIDFALLRQLSKKNNL